MKLWICFLFAAGFIAGMNLVVNNTMAGVNPAVGYRIKEHCDSLSLDSNICNAIYAYVEDLNGGCPSGNGCIQYVAKRVTLNVGSKRLQTESFCKLYFSN